MDLKGASSSERLAGPERADLLGEPARPRGPVSIRALLAGLISVIALSVISIHCTLGVGTGGLNCWDFLLETAVFMLIVVIAANRLLGLLAPGAALNRGELATVFVMLLAAAPVPSIGFITRLIPAIGGITYHIRPESHWGEWVLPHVSSWVAPRAGEAVSQLFEGLPKHGVVPWGVWTKPLLFWSGFFMTLAFASICLAVIMRKQWIERERLSYPIMQLALSLLESEGKSQERPIWRSRIFLIGAVFAFCFGSLHPISRYLQDWMGWTFDPPDMSWYWLTAGRTFSLRFKISWSIIGLSYLIPQDVALSVWLFNLIFQIQGGLYRVLGIDATPGHAWGIRGGPALSGQAVGAFMFIGASALWLGRRHLAAVLRSAFGRPGERADETGSGDMLSYPVAFWGIAASGVAMLFFLHVMGTPLWLSMVMLAAAFCFLVAMTKIVVQCGLGWVQPPIAPTVFVNSLVGAGTMSHATVTSLGVNYIWTSPMRLQELGAVSHGLKVTDQLSLRRKGLVPAMLLAIMVALVAGSVFHLYYAYSYGGLNMYGWFYRGYAMRPWQFAEHTIDVARPIEWGYLGFVGMGAGVAGVMQVLRHTFTWFPFSVIGFGAAHLPTSQKYWFSVFLVWLLKGRLINYGGMRAYRAGRPFFLGLLMGQAVALGFWYLVATLAREPYGGVPW